MNYFYSFIIVIYIVDILALFYYGIHLYILVFLYLKNKKNCKTNNEELEVLIKKMKKWPKVTIQLPIFNEYYVVERLIKSVCQIDYPKSKLQIQVLDDSTDETRFVARKLVKEYKQKGFDIQYIHRENREGHKAGALKEALKKAKGEFIGIFDADFIPPRDFFKKTVPHFYKNNKLGMVQTRWGHTNQDYSLLTKAQSIGIDGHFIIEHTARNGSGLWMNFNGTAGVWRKKCILDAGDWHYDTLTEDFDLSYRALLKGWKFQYLYDIISPAELPPTISAFKSQQFRWAKGSIQTCKKLLPKIFKSKNPLKVKLEAGTHLLGYTVHPLIVLNVLLTLPVLFFRTQNEFLSTTVIYSAAMILAVSTLAPVIFYAVSQKALYKNWLNRMRHMPALTMIGTGIALNNTKAWFEAILGKKSAFIRTPKLKIDTTEEKVINKMKYNNFKLDAMILLEFSLGVYILFTFIIAIMAEKYIISPFLLLYSAGFFYVCYLAVSDNLKSFFYEKKQKYIIHKIIRSKA
ncbi:MAG: glycosyltransferase family 2 protein [Spirochaetia bacterium]|nr:glycosyltransferase family 2 protein [Spirochaetia bacterium]